jgi:uncharacterized protein DUF2750
MRQRIVSLGFASPPDWALAAERLERLVGDADVKLVRVDEARGCLLIAAEDPAKIQRKLARWLKEIGGARIGDPIDGEIVSASRGALTDEERIVKFAAGVLAGGCVWGLRKKTWARSSAGKGREALPLWPDEESAARCIAGEWARYRARPIALDGFLAEWLPGMVEDGIVAVLFPDPDHPGAVVSAKALLTALRNARP